MAKNVRRFEGSLEKYMEPSVLWGRSILIIINNNLTITPENMTAELNYLLRVRSKKTYINIAP